jgi:hypothetical protein
MDDLEYNFEKADERAARLDRHLAEALQKLQSYEDTGVIQEEGGRKITGVSKKKVKKIQVFICTTRFYIMYPVFKMKI